MRSVFLTSSYKGLHRSSPKFGARVFQVVMLLGLILVVSGGLSSAWAGEKGRGKAPSPYLHLTGFSVHIGPGGFHLGIGGPRYWYSPPPRHFRPFPRFYRGPGKGYWHKHRFRAHRPGWGKPGRGHGGWKAKKQFRGHRKGFRGGRGARGRR